MRVVIEGACDQHIEPGIASLTGGGDEIWSRNRAKLRTDKNGGPFLLAGSIAFHIATLGAYKIARPWTEGGEDDLVFFVRLLNAGGFQVIQNHLDKIPLFA